MVPRKSFPHSSHSTSPHPHHLGRMILNATGDCQSLSAQVLSVISNTALYIFQSPPLQPGYIANCLPSRVHRLPGALHTGCRSRKRRVSKNIRFTWKLLGFYGGQSFSLAISFDSPQLGRSFVSNVPSQYDIHPLSHEVHPLTSTPNLAFLLQIPENKRPLDATCCLKSGSQIPTRFSLTSNRRTDKFRIGTFVHQTVEFHLA